MYYTYVLRSLKDGLLYIGMTADVDSRLRHHNAGKVCSTRHRRPFVLLYFESFPTRTGARRRETYFKSGPGHKALKNIIGKTRPDWSTTSG